MLLGYAFSPVNLYSGNDLLYLRDTQPVHGLRPQCFCDVQPLYITCFPDFTFTATASEKLRLIVARMSWKLGSAVTRAPVCYSILIVLSFQATFEIRLFIARMTITYIYIRHRVNAI